MADPLFVLYDGDCGLCSRTAEALRLLDHAGRLRLVPLQRAAAELGAVVPSLPAMRAALHAGDSAGGWSVGGEAALRIAQAIPALRTLAIVGRLPLLNRLVEPAYRFLASHRQHVGRLVGADRCRFDGDETVPEGDHLG